MSEPADDETTIARSDLRIAATIVSVRLTDPQAEQQRLVLMDELLRLESNLGRTLVEHARHALSESRGSHSAWDVAADTEAVHEALMQYGRMVHRIANTYRSLVRSLMAPEADEV